MRVVVRAEEAPLRRFVLASASSARLSVLRTAGLNPEVIVSGVDEGGVEESSAAEHALVLACRKAVAVKEKLTGESALVLGCDSVLELDGRVYGKPGSPVEAVRRWRRMRGRSGILHTGHCVVETGSGRFAKAVGSTIVHFAHVSDADIEAYVESGEPLGVAGGFKIDGLGGAFVERVEGDPYNVMGVSLPLLRRIVAEFGVGWYDLWVKRQA
jgi:septum formation protein